MAEVKAARQAIQTTTVPIIYIPFIEYIRL
jgi:hypothetical protein